MRYGEKSEKREGILQDLNRRIDEEKPSYHTKLLQKWIRDKEVTNYNYEISQYYILIFVCNLFLLGTDLFLVTLITVWKHYLFGKIKSLFMV